jgi:hypothetical protein
VTKQLACSLEATHFAFLQTFTPTLILDSNLEAVLDATRIKMLKTHSDVWLLSSHAPSIDVSTRSPFTTRHRHSVNQMQTLSVLKASSLSNNQP